MINLKLDWLHWVLFAALGILLALFWLTPYTYHQNAGILVRIHRVTGKAEMLHSGGWEQIGAEGTRRPGFRSTTEQQRKLPSEFVDDLGLLKKNPMKETTERFADRSSDY